MKGWSAKEKETMKGSGDADRSFRPEPPMCKCGRRHVHKVGFKCFDCRKEQKEREENDVPDWDGADDCT